MLNIALDTAFKIETVAPTGSFFLQMGVNALGQVGGVAQAIQDAVVAKLDTLFEDGFVGVKGDLGTGAVGFADDFEVALGGAPLILLLLYFTVTTNLLDKALTTLTPTPCNPPDTL